MAENNLPVEALLSRVSSEQLLRALLKKMYTDGALQLDFLLSAFQEARQEEHIPASVFSYSLAPAEALCLYLKEHQHLTPSRIALLLGRNPKSTWATCKRAATHRVVLRARQTDYLLPLSLFRDRRYSLLEHTIKYLQNNHHLTNRQIAEFLHKSPQSIAVLAKRAREK